MSNNNSLHSQLMNLGVSEDHFFDLIALYNMTIKINALDPAQNGKLMTAAETAEFLGLSTKTFTTKLLPQYDNFPRIRIGNSWRYNRAEILKWIEDVSLNYSDYIDSWTDMLD